MIRKELSNIIALAEDLQTDEMPAVLTTLFAAHGSTYRPLGSKMVGGPSPEFMAGGVSGGWLPWPLLGLHAPNQIAEGVHLAATILTLVPVILARTSFRD